MGNQIPDIPRGLAGDALVALVNDRLRMVQRLLGSASNNQTVVTLAGGGGVIRENYYVIPISGGRALPNLAFGANQELILTAADITVLRPAGSPGPTTFTLLIVQDDSGGRVPTLDPTYFGYIPANEMLTGPNTATWLTCKILDDGSILVKQDMTGIAWT